MSDRDSLAGFSEAAGPEDAPEDNLHNAVSFISGRRPIASAQGPLRTDPIRHAFRARPREHLARSNNAQLRTDPPLEFAIRPPPDTEADVETRIRADGTELQLESPPSSNQGAEFDTALLRERIEARHGLGSVSPSNSASDSGISAAITGLTRWIEQPSDSSVATRIRGQQRRSHPSLPLPGNSKRQRLTELPEDNDEDGQSAVSGIFGRPGSRTEPPVGDHGFDFDNNDFGDDIRDADPDIHDGRAAPSIIRSDRANSEAFNNGEVISDDTEASAIDEGTAPQPSIIGNYVRPRPRDPGEPEPPVVFEVPVSLIPEIDWLSVALDAEGQVLEQRLEHSESESDSDESMGSVAEMVVSDTETEAESDGNAAWEPKTTVDTSKDDASSDTDQSSDSDTASFTAATVPESEDSDFTPDVQVQVAELGNRSERPKRHRIPTVKWWLGERIQYDVDGPLHTMTAVDVRRVEPEKKVYRRRRPYRRRRGPLLPADEDELEADQLAVHAPVLDAEGGKFRERTVARSINGLEFEPMHYSDGSLMPLVSRCAIFGGSSAASVQLYVLRIQPGAVYTYEADVNKVCTFVVWRGRCTAKMNRTDFDLQKGMACIVPPANDLYVDNSSNTERGARGLGEDVFFFATEINARDAPDLAAAMTRDAQSVVSGAATLSKLFELDRDDDLDLDQGAESFVSGLHRFTRPSAITAPNDSMLEEPEPLDADGGGLLDEDHHQLDVNDQAPSAGIRDSDYPGGDADDAVSVVPSIFHDLQDEYDRRQPQNRDIQPLSFQIGRNERPKTAAVTDSQSYQALPSFHLERGSGFPGNTRSSHPLRRTPSQDQAGQRHTGTQIVFRNRGIPQHSTANTPGRHKSAEINEDELEDFFAQVNHEEPDDRTTHNRILPPTLPHQYMLDRLTRIARPPNDTDTQSSA